MEGEKGLMQALGRLKEVLRLRGRDVPGDAIVPRVEEPVVTNGVPNGNHLGLNGHLDEPVKVDAAAFFAGRRVALFSVPGAFTPTCSARHLPSFVERADELKAKGIDEIAATAVNDAFVLAAWGRDAGATDSVTMLADGNGEFVKALGLTMDGSAYGLGTRGQRFSMVVDSGVVTQLNVEAPGEYQLSSAEHMLAQL